MVILCLVPLMNYAQVSVDFSANVTSGCGSLQVSFTDQSTSSAAALTSWTWDLGGVASTATDPGRIFGTPGQFTICLTVTDEDDNSATLCKDDYITVFELPVPDFSVQETDGCIPFEVEFTNLSSSVDGNITQLIWGVGGSAGVIVDENSLPTIDNLYSLADSYTVSLTVTDDNNCTSTITRDDYITVHPDPIISFVADDTFSCTAPFIVNFTNTSPDQSLDFKWFFGNGEIHNGLTPPPISYNELGLYDVMLIGVDPVTGCTDTLVQKDLIKVSYPASFTHTPEEGCEDLEVSFQDTSPDPLESISWNFGDGNTSTDLNPTHTYTAPGCYTVVMTRVVNGCVSIGFTDRCIKVFPQPDVVTTNDNQKGCTAPHLVNFTSSYPADIVNVEWDFGDGNTSDLQNPSHQFESTGIFPVKLKLTNSSGCVSTVPTDTIYVVELDARIAMFEQIGCTPLSVNFIETSQTVAPVNNWQWDIALSASAPAAPQTSTDQIPTFNLVDTGFYDLRLIVTNEIGCIDTSTFLKVAAVGQEPNVDFDGVPTVSCINTAITFSDNSDTYVNAWYWEFGESGTSEEQHPFYEYADTGFFDVTLTALHHGCPNTIQKEEYIEVVPPKAGFNLEYLCASPYQVTLLDNTIGADSIFYDFGVPGIDTDTSTNRTPTYSFATTGEYIITQIVQNFTTGCADTAIQVINITDPKSLFSFSTTQGCVPLNITVTDVSEFADSWLWSADDATFSSTVVGAPTITYDTPGAYTDIKLVITDINGCQDSLIYTDTIFANGVNANLSVLPSGGCLPLTTDFTDLSTSVYGEINDWDWTFGDTLGGTSKDQLPNYTYTEAGIFDVSLTATDDWGCTGSITINNAVEVTDPKADFTASDSLSCRNNNIVFTNYSSGVDLTYTWDFGDGVSSTDEEPTHMYTVEGSFTVCLTTKDKYGCENTNCKSDYIVIADPLAAFTQDNNFGTCPPLLVNFENNSLNANAYEWNFGDDSGSSSLENPPHVYTVPGTYDVQLIAVATESCQDTLEIEDLIILEGPLGEFSYDIDTSCAPALITFVGTSLEPYNFIWDFGDGMLDTTFNITKDSLGYFYREAGQFIPKLILVDAANCQRTLQSPDTIYIANLDIDFLATRTILCDNVPGTQFFNTSQSSEPIKVSEWTFTDGDPANSTDFEPFVEFANPGTFDVKLIADNGICRDSLTKEDYIRVGAVPIVNYEMTDTTGCIPLTVGFNDLSTVVDGTITNWEWDFGDQSQATLDNPTHIFNDEGSYEVQLTVTSNIGCKDSITYPLETLPVPSFEIGTEPLICIGESTKLSPNILSDTTGASYYWLPSPDLSCTDCIETLANPSDTTTFTFVVTNNLGCSKMESIQVNVKPFPAPVIDLTPDTSICADGIIQLKVAGGDILSGYQWDQSTPGLSCYDACINPIASPSETSMYVVSVTNEYGCMSQDSVEVGVVNQAQEFAGDDRTICLGDTVQLNTSTGNDTRWIETDGLTCTFCPDPIAQPTNTTNYLVRVTTDEGCLIYDSVQVNIISQEDISAGDPSTICSGEGVVLNGNGEGSVSWSPAVTLDDANSFTPEASPTELTNYIMTVEKGDCILNDTVAIYVNTQTEISTEDITICYGDSIHLSVIGEADQFNWSPSESILDLTTEATPKVAPSESTVYYVSASLSSCAPDTDSIYVEVIPSPEYRLQETFSFFPGQEVTLGVHLPDSLVDYEFEWGPSDSLSCVFCPSPTVMLDSSGYYSLLVTDMETGCSSSDTTFVQRVETCGDELIYVPNAFSPNDDGNNDKFEFFLSPAMTGKMKNLRIFDRWGALVFESPDASEWWDGTTNGRQSPVGVYIYMVEVPCEYDGSMFVKAGDITLIR